MKKMFSILAMTFVALPSFAVQVKSAKLDAENKHILIDVTYGGGCGKHEFSLKMEPCLETYPVRCSAQLIDTTTDSCEALLSGTVVIPLSKYNLDDDYFKGGSLSIRGQSDWAGEQSTKATIVLPK